MKFNEIFVGVCIMAFYYLLREFIDLGGMSYNLLKLLMKLIILLFIMILFKYKEEIKQSFYFDKYQKKLDDFLKKNGK